MYWVVPYEFNLGGSSNKVRVIDLDDLVLEEIDLQDFIMVYESRPRMFLNATYTDSVRIVNIGMGSLLTGTNSREFGGITVYLGDKRDSLKIVMGKRHHTFLVGREKIEYLDLGRSKEVIPVLTWEGLYGALSLSLAWLYRLNNLIIVRFSLNHKFSQERGVYGVFTDKGDFLGLGINNDITYSPFKLEYTNPKFVTLDLRA